MQNMRRTLISPQSLRMADGGFFGGLKRAVGLGPPETMTQKFARQDAERAAKAPAAAVAPVAPAAPAQTGISGSPGWSVWPS